MLPSIFPVISSDKINSIVDLSAKAGFEGYAITISSNIISTELNSLFSQKNKYCFYLDNFDSIFSNKENFALLIKDIIPFFFDYNYIKESNNPLLLILIDKQDKVYQEKIHEELTKIINGQGFSGVELLFIYNNQTNNFTDTFASGYYSFEPFDFTKKSDELEKLTLLLLSGRLLSERLFIKCHNDENLIIAFNNINVAITKSLKENSRFSGLLQSFSSISIERKNLLQKNILLQKKLDDYHTFLQLSKETYNADIKWHENEIKKIKDWSNEEIKKLKDWYFYKYEILPSWYKNLGKKILKLSFMLSKGSKNT